MSKHSTHDKKQANGEAIPQEAEAQVTPEQDPGTPESGPSREKTGDNRQKPEDPANRIAALEAELTEVRDQYLRKAAEFENFRKRMNREKQEAIDFANQSLLLDLIPVIDDFERAIKSSETSKDYTSFHEGVTMIEKRLVSQLENKWGLKRFESAGTPFDPERHEAIMMDKSPDVSDPMVAEDFLKGYTLKDRVVRSAKVKVLMPAEPAPSGPATGVGEGINEGESPKTEPN